MIPWLKERTNLHVRAALPIVEDANTGAVHLWFDARSEAGERGRHFGRPNGGVGRPSPIET